MKSKSRFDQVPDPEDYMPVREAYLLLQSARKGPTRTDLEMRNVEEKLRERWGCDDALPASFDPDLLERAWVRRRGRGVGEGVRLGMDDVVAVAGVLAGEKDENENENEDGSGDEEEQIERKLGFVGESFAEEARSNNYNDEDDNNNKSKKTTNDMERTPTPRIRKGSKPPLSRSAFVEGGVPCLDEKCGGACRRCVASRLGKGKGKGSGNGYFPFRSRVRR